MLTTSRRRARSDVLIQSVLRCHPEATVSRVWCDARVDQLPGDDVLLAQSIDFAPLRWADLVLALGQHSAGWAGLPWVLESLGRSGRSAGPVVVLDDTFVVVDRLDDLVGGSAPVARARHVEPGSARAWGGPLPGLLALPETSDPLLEWWRDRVIDVVTDGSARAATTTERPWWTQVEGLELIADERFRLTAGTADEVELDVVDDVVMTGSGPLALADLAEFDPRRPWWFAPNGVGAGATTSASAGLRRLCQRHADALNEAGWDQSQEALDEELLLGVPATDGLRRWYRGLLGADETPPNPYVAGEVDAFVALLRAPGSPDGTGVSVAADIVYDERDDLRVEFESPRWRDRGRFRHWLWTSALRESATALATLPPPPAPVAPIRVTGPRSPFGVNLVGYLGAELGLGVAARQMLRALEAAGVPTSTVTYDRTSSSQGTRADGTAERPYHFNLMLIVPDQLPLFVRDVGPGFLEGHHNIGLWYWESDVMSESQLPAFGYVDEVWAATSYLRDSFASAGRAPVALVPSPLVFDDVSSSTDDRARLGLDQRFTFLFSFDFLSVAERKNPLGLIEAYRRAFGPDDGTRLILKSINGDVFPDERERVAVELADRPDIELWDRMLPASDRLALVAAADCYVSLHRAEGLGLTMAEAMAVGTPVIATGYSGNLDFMDDRSALLVPYELVEVGAGSHYPAHGRWASPDLDAAARLMRAARDDASLRARLVPAARRALSPFSYDEVGRIARDRLIEVWRATAPR